METFHIRYRSNRGAYTVMTMRLAIKEFVGLLLLKGVVSSGETIRIFVNLDRRLSWVPEFGYIVQVKIPPIGNN